MIEFTVTELEKYVDKHKLDLIEELIEEYAKEDERSHFGLKLLSVKDELSNKK